MLRVLVVEDNATNRTVLDNMLRGWGMRVTLAHDGRHAIELLESLGPQAPGFDLAVVDWRMPRLDGIGFARALRERGLQPRMKLIMLSSVSLPDDVRQAQEIGFLRFVHKPVRKTELRQVILGVTAPTVDAQASLPQIGKDVLVIEDNKVNQEVVQHMLQALGCRVRVAGSAVEGLNALCERRFDVLLMDIQMPGMDGVSALNLFRAGPGPRYAFRTPPSTPVLAVTANALAGDEERYLNMGFNAYLSKPFRMVQLLQLLTRVLGPSPGAVPAAAAPAPAAVPPSSGTPTMSTDPTPPGDDGSPPLDALALQRLRDLDPTGQNRLVERVLQAFETSIDRMSVNLDEALTLKDLQVVRHVTHTLKSSAASVGALGLSRLCADTEALVRQGQPVPDLAERVSAIQSEMRRVRGALRIALAPATVENPRS
jgi:CheY-like chemotaxis protein/HPt (histidine-containing phosphotransfer) domain-containing protein